MHIDVLVRCVCLALGLSLAAGTVHAAPVTWFLQGVTLADGATATGSYVFDADLVQFSAINVSVMGGTEYPGTTIYDELNPGKPAHAFRVAFLTDPPAIGDSSVQIRLDGSMTNTGGTIPITITAGPNIFQNSSMQARCDNAACSTYTSPFNLITAGSVTTVPIPSAILLFGSGLAGLVGWRWKRGKQA